MNKLTILTIVFAIIALASTFLYTQMRNDSYDLSKHYSYYEKFTYNNEIISENILSISYGDYITNRYGVQCVQEFISLQSFEGETLHNTRRLISIDNNNRYLCGYYIPSSNRYAFYNDKEIMPLGLLAQYPANMEIGTVINVINVSIDNSLCRREVVSDQTTRIDNTNYRTKLIQLECDSPQFKYSLESFFNDSLRTVILETETYTYNNNTYSIYRELINAK